MKVTDEELEKLDKWVGDFKFSLKDIKHDVSFLKFSEDNQKIVDDGLDIIKSKLKAIKKARDVDELNKILKVKKILGRKK